MNKLLLENYQNYLNQGGKKNLEEFLNEMTNVINEKKEKEVLLELYEDDLNCENYYENLNESLVNIDNSYHEGEHTNTINDEEFKARYAKYKAKRKKEGKEVLTPEEWLKAQKHARELRHEAAKAGIKVLGAVGSTVALSKVVKDKYFKKTNKDGSTIELGSKTTHYPTGRKSKKKKETKELNEVYDGNFDNPTKLRFLGMLGGGEFKNDLKSALHIANNDTARAKAMEYAMTKGETFKEKFLRGNGTYGLKDSILYRKNGILPGGRAATDILYRYGDYARTKTASEIYRDIYKHLKSKDRKRIMDAYIKYKNGK